MRSYFTEILCAFLLGLQCDCYRDSIIPAYTPLVSEEVDGAILAEDSTIHVLIGGQVVLNGLQSIVENIGQPQELKRRVAHFMEQLRANHLSDDPMEILRLGRSYFNVIEKKGYTVAPENKRLLITAFNLMGHIFAQRPTDDKYIPGIRRKHGPGGQPITINVLNDKTRVEEVIRAIKEGLASGTKGVDGKNINQNLNFNVNLVTLLNLGQRLKRNKII